MKHIGALIGIAVVVFGATFLFTSDWPDGGQDEQVAQVSEEAASPPAQEEEATEEQPAQEEEVAQEGEEASPEPAPADEQTAQTEGQFATEVPATRAASEEAEGGETETAQADTGAEQESAAEDPAAGDSEDAGDQAASADVDIEQLMQAGGDIYTNTCAACHGAEGEGTVGPAFADNANLEDAEYVAETIIHGQGGMPPFGDQLSDEDVAAVATYIRNSWGNEFGPLTPEDAEASR